MLFFNRTNDPVVKRAPGGKMLRHYIIVFSEDEVKEPRNADAIAQAMTACIGQEFQVVFAVHEDKLYLHIHI